MQYITFAIWLGATFHKSYRVLGKLLCRLNVLHNLIHAETYSWNKDIRINKEQNWKPDNWKDAIQ